MYVAFKNGCLFMQIRPVSFTRYLKAMLWLEERT